MCLIKQDKQTEEFRKKLESGPVEVYKVVLVHNETTWPDCRKKVRIYSPYYCDFNWRAGWNSTTEDEFGTCQGLHVFLDLIYAEHLLSGLTYDKLGNWCVKYQEGDRFSIIKAKGLLEHFIAAGIDDSSLTGGCPSATFIALFVEEKELESV